MAEKYEPSRPLLDRRTQIEKARAALKAAGKALGWAQDNAHGKEHWEQVCAELERFEEISAGFDEAAASPDAPIQVAAAEGYRDYVIEKYFWGDTEAEVVLVPPAEKGDPHEQRPAAKTARAVLRLVRGGLSMHERYIREKDTGGNLKTGHVAQAGDYDERIDLIVEGQTALRKLPLTLLRTAVRWLEDLSRPSSQDP